MNWQRCAQSVSDTLELKEGGRLSEFIINLTSLIIPLSSRLSTKSESVISFFDKP